MLLISIILLNSFLSVNNPRALSFTQCPRVHFSVSGPSRGLTALAGMSSWVVLWEQLLLLSLSSMASHGLQLTDPGTVLHSETSEPWFYLLYSWGWPQRSCMEAPYLYAPVCYISRSPHFYLNLTSHSEECLSALFIRKTLRERYL